MSRTLLLGLDGATFTLLDPAMEAGVMPFLRAAIARGVRADLESTPCPVTPPAWTTIMTGRNPGTHGVFDFIRVTDETDPSQGFRLVNGRDVRCETIWSVATRQGRKVAALNFPATFNLPPFGGALVPGFVTARLLRTSTQPRELWDRIKTLPDFNAKDAAWNLDEGRKPLGRGLDSAADYGDWIDYLKRKERAWAAVAQHLVETDPPDLLAIVFECADRLQHQVWHLLDPASLPAALDPEEAALRESSLDYYRLVDRLMERLVNAAGPDTRVVVASDHGFGPTTEVFYANTWLERAGYFHWKPSAVADDGEMLSAENMRDHFAAIDFSRTLAYARTTSANGIYIRIARTPGEPGVRPEDYGAFRARLARELAEWRDPATGTAVVTRVVTRDEAFPGGCNDEAPDLTVTIRDGGFISILRSDVIVRPREGVKGTHRPEGVFVAFGPGIRRGVRLPMQRIVDVAPTLLASAGVPIPSDLDGAPLVEIFDPAFLAEHPIQRGAPTLPIADLGKAAAAEEMDASSEEAILTRLKNLGYME